ncbi:spermidine synthase [Pseudoalteromonas denitrificans]|uniref:Spermine/spermidine synthase n=1 Tax=Pseudoalteromonas denitrificans DSM 6059 TaxID=1123010 RepID=A0A1I1RMK8_9GAMM|nr:fused MFS/spermidine synthase [Pseudoalteromonas denitrificans]SFD31650.1 Spermine/spermidine synthase [Pseudoalteromonas denitrificans DSM 6059]
MDYIKAKTGVISHNFIKHCNDIGHVLYWHKQYGQNVQVRQYKQLRWLLIDHILQSVIEKDNPEHLLFPHLKSLSNIWRPLTIPGSVLELGLGAGAVRNYLQLHYPNAQITTVEKNSEIIHCYKKYFGGFAASNLHCEDATTELKNKSTFDWVIIDLFSKTDPPIFLFKQEFYDDIYHILNTNGWVFINFVAEHESQLIQLKKILKTVFGKTPKHKKIAEYSNHLLWLQI